MGRLMWGRPIATQRKGPISSSSCAQIGLPHISLPISVCIETRLRNLDQVLDFRNFPEHFQMGCSDRFQPRHLYMLANGILLVG